MINNIESITYSTKPWLLKSHYYKKIIKNFVHFKRIFKTQIIQYNYQINRQNTRSLIKSENNKLY